MVGCSSVCYPPRSSLHSVRFGDLLRCADKRIVNIMKMYIERKKMHVKLISLRINFIEVGNLEVGNFRERRIY